MGLFFPPVLLKEYQGLSPPYSHQEFSLARCIINTYIFCALPMPDLICYLFSTIKLAAKAKRNLSVDTMIPLVTFQNVVRILSDNLERSAALGYILTTLTRNEAKLGQEISLEDIILLGMKYPLLFYEARRFQNHMRRLFFGDYFWEDRNYLKTRLEGLSPEADWVPHAHDYKFTFASEYEAARVSAATILTDIYHVSHSWDNGLQRRAKPAKSSHSSSSGSIMPIRMKIPPGSPLKRKEIGKYSWNRHANASIVPASGSAISVLTTGSNVPSTPSKKGLDATSIDSGSKVKTVVFGHTHEPNGTLLEQHTAIEKNVFRASEIILLRMKLNLTVTQHPRLESIEKPLCTRVKDLVGYRIARALILESNIPFIGEMPFLVEYEACDDDEFHGVRYNLRLAMTATSSTGKDKKNSSLKWSSPVKKKASTSAIITDSDSPEMN